METPMDSQTALDLLGDAELIAAVALSLHEWLSAAGLVGQAGLAEVLYLRAERMTAALEGSLGEG
jgi:hypothetical protein